MKSSAMTAWMIAALLAISATVASPSLAAITSVFPTGGNLLMHVDCPHPSPGSTDLEPLVWNSAETLQLLNYDFKLDNNLSDQFPANWDYGLGYDLTGTLTVEKYIAFDGPVACEHGAEIIANLSITSGLDAGQQFSWLQVFHETGNSGSRSWTADPPAAATGEDDWPFYYNATEDFYDENANLWTFRDRPYDRIDDSIPHSGSVSFMLLLASWDGSYDGPTDSNDVTVYGGLEWGYDYACVPEPSTLVIWSLLAALGIACGWRGCKLL